MRIKKLLALLMVAALMVATLDTSVLPVFARDNLGSEIISINAGPVSSETSSEQETPAATAEEEGVQTGKTKLTIELKANEGSIYRNATATTEITLIIPEKTLPVAEIVTGKKTEKTPDKTDELPQSEPGTVTDDDILHVEGDKVEDAVVVTSTEDSTTVDSKGKKGVELTENMVEDIADNLEGKSVDFTLGKYGISFDEEAFRTLQEESQAIGGEGEDHTLRIVADDVPEEKLTKAQQKTVEAEKPEALLEVYVEADGKRISSFKGNATVSFKFVVPDGKDAVHYLIKYINPDGNTSYQPTWFIGNQLNFRTTHNSEYMLVYDETFTNGKPADEPVYMTVRKVMGVGNRFNLVGVAAKGKKLTYSSSDKTIATVTKKGVITAKKAGTCTITAECGNYRFILKLVVRNRKINQKQTPTESAWLDETDSAVITMYKRIEKNRKFSFTFGGDGDADITYDIADKSIAKIKNGKLVGVSKGTTTVDVHVVQDGVESIYRFFVKVNK